MKSALSSVQLTLFALSQLSILEALVLPNFYPFGQSEGDQLVPTNDDGSSGTIPISVPFPFFDRNHNSLFVNTNGVISFLVQVSQYTPDTFPLDGNRRVVAPFWADVNTNNGGEVFYRETTDPNLLQQATDDVKSVYVGQRKFRATWLLVATWYKVAFFGASGNYTKKTNTFQAVLITNGKHSFVIYNYNNITWTTGTASGGNVSGLGGSPAQAGFNAGDGIRYFNVPGSATDRIINVSSNSNVGKPGRWMFRIDSAKIEAGGCNTKGSLVASPHSVMMLGGDNIFVGGPCYEPSNLIVCEFPGGKLSNGTYINNIQSSCTVPMLNVTGRLTIKMSINGGKSFDFRGILTVVNIKRVPPRVDRLVPSSWSENVPVKINWDLGHLGVDTLSVAVLLARFSMKDDDVYFHSMFSLKEEQKNTGESQFTVPEGEGQGAAVGDSHFVTLVLVKKISGNFSNSPAEWIWSDMFYWFNYGLAEQRCMFWHDRQPDPQIYTDDATLLPCPQTFLQAQADRGRFTLDEYCNPTADPYQCVLYHFGASHCFRANIPSEQGAGQQCCYSRPGNLMIGPQNGGSLDRYHIEAGVPALSHFFQDLVPYLDCCLLSDNCERYFEKRPSDDGSRYVPPRPATGITDPHMITLDGFEYTFNGYGEYHVLQIPPIDFELQGRMQPLIDDNGSSTSGTVFKAFAMKENGSDVVQIHINGRREIEILVNSALVEFDEQFMMDFQGATVIKYNNTSKYSIIFNSGLSVTIERVEDLLQFMLLVPPEFKEHTRGLLGFWDGNQENDFLLPSGASLSHNSTHSRIHYEFGQLWATNADNSLFTYEEGKNHTSYFDKQYVPTFMDPDNMVFDNATLGHLAYEVCGDNKQCLFDIKATGKVSIGQAAKKAVGYFFSLTNDLETPGCIPMENKIGNGNVVRNDTQDGRIIYRFQCNSGFFLHGSSVISCLQGQWNGSTPSCLPGKASYGTPGYVIAAATAGAAIFVVIAIIGVICFLKVRRGKGRSEIYIQEATEMDSSK